MGSQASVIKPTGTAGVLLALVPPALTTIAAIAIWGSDRGLPVGVLAYVFYRLVIVRRLVCRDHRAGVAFTRRGKFEEAIAAFRRSEDFWGKHPTLDRFRALVLGSPTSHTFYVFALYNQAYCLSRLGRGDEAQALVERVLSKHPDMVPARELRDVMAAGRAVSEPRS